MLLRSLSFLTILLHFSSPIHAQIPPPTAPPTTACNPFLTVCPSVPCESSAATGYVTVLSPNITTYFYVGQPIVIAWEYSALTDVATYPANNVSVWYLKEQPEVREEKWTVVGVVGREVRNLTWDMPEVVAGPGGVFKIRVVPDSVDNSLATGHAVSCTPPGWPWLGQVSFRVVRPTPLQLDGDPFPPAMSSTVEQIQTMIKSLRFWVGTIVAGLIGLWVM
ncbi:hypothetical protein DFJ77DRAFT_316916 [Powellomyces hirtus]|nr:hypothetical protein DFJ77DRAFT_316916 [Powellomyces hirtus]